MKPALPPSRSEFASRRAAGFTLLELIVAAGITALLAGFMAVIVANVSGFWTRSSGRLSAESQARYILDQLALDLQSAQYRDDTGVWLAADVLNGTGNSGAWDARPNATTKPPSATGTTLRYDAPDIGAATFGRAGVWLRFFTSRRGDNATRDTLSAPVAVGWQIVRRASSTNATSTDRRYFLHRAEVRPAHTGGASGTLDSGFDITAPAYDSDVALSENAGATGDPRAVRTAPPESIVGDNVIDFGVRFYAHDTSGVLQRIFPASTQTSYRASTPPGVGAPETQFPEVVDVMVRILTDEGARLIAGFEANPQRVSRPPSVATDAQYWWPLALAHSQVFTRRIVVAPRSL